jgi:hypothetical protein
MKKGNRGLWKWPAAIVVATSSSVRVVEPDIYKAQQFLLHPRQRLLTTLFHPRDRAAAYEQ